MNKQEALDELTKVLSLLDNACDLLERLNTCEKDFQLRYDIYEGKEHTDIAFYELDKVAHELKTKIKLENESNTDS